MNMPIKKIMIIMTITMITYLLRQKLHHDTLSRADAYVRQQRESSASVQVMTWCLFSNEILFEI